MSITNLYEIKDGDSGQTVANGLKQNFTDVVTDLNTKITAEDVKTTDIDASLDLASKNDIARLEGKVIGKRTALTPLFENAGAVFNDATGYYELNELNDLTEQDMMEISMYPKFPLIVGASIFNYRSYYGRTNSIPNKRVSISVALSFTNACEYCPNLETLDVGLNQQILINGLNYAFRASTKMRKVLGVLNCRYMPNDATGCFTEMPMFEEIFLKEVKVNIPFTGAPKLNETSIEYMIVNSIAEKSIVFTLHPTAYAMAIASAKITAALASKPLVSIASA